MSTDTRLPLWPEGVERVVLDEVDSTMAEAQRRAPPAKDIWIMARRQTAGRGRQGRAWSMPKGNFAATFLTRPERPPADIALTSFQAALAVYDTLALHVDRARLSNKWPNDVLLDGCKVSGILLESSGQGGAVNWLAVGIGMNLVATPDPDDLESGALPAISLRDAGVAVVDPSETLVALAFHMQLYAKMWRETGFDALRLLWLRRAAGVGQDIRARTPRETLHGRFETIDEHGRLVVQTPNGVQKITAGDVFFG